MMRRVTQAIRDAANTIVCVYKITARRRRGIRLKCMFTHTTPRWRPLTIYRMSPS